MRSVIEEANIEGIKKVVAQQFEVALQILKAGSFQLLNLRWIFIAQKKRRQKIC